MQIASDKVLNCPFCLNPLTDAGYSDHLLTCKNKDHEILSQRLTAIAGIKIPHHDKESLISEYKQTILYDDSYFPECWNHDDSLTNTSFHQVDFKTAEANAVINRVNSDVVIKRIERVQNKELFLKYSDYVKSRQGQEFMLFHGSQHKNYNLICNQGFDLGHSNDGLHGFGIYLSSTMSYSLAFARKTLASSWNQMLLCRTWVSSETTIADNIHVVHCDYAVYPEYILYYK